MITVAEMMTTDTRTLSPRDTLADVQAMMAKYNCHHVPITDDNGLLVGLVSQRDVLRIAESRLRADGPQILAGELPIAEFMTGDIFSINPETSLRKAATYIRAQRYGCLPVIKDNQLVGIITDSDFVNIAIDLLEQLEHAEPAPLD